MRNVRLPRAQRGRAAPAALEKASQRAARPRGAQQAPDARPLVAASSGVQAERTRCAPEQQAASSSSSRSSAAPVPEQQRRASVRAPASKILDYVMDMSSESSAARWYEPPRSLEPASGSGGAGGAGGAAGNNPVVGNPGDYRGYYPHAGPTHHPAAAAAAHYAHSEYTPDVPYRRGHSAAISRPPECAPFIIQRRDGGRGDAPAARRRRRVIVLLGGWEKSGGFGLLR